MASPEMQSKMRAALEAWKAIPGNITGRAKGQPDGVRKKDWLKLKAKAEVKAEEAIKIMAEKKVWIADNDIAEKAMQSAIAIMESHTGETRTRLAAAKAILDFVQTKPVVKNETTIKSAEAFLEALSQEEGNEPQS